MSAMVRKSGGFTLIEMIITIVVISVGLAGVLLTFQTVVKSSADPLVTKQMISIAEAQMESAMLKEFADIVSDSTCFVCPTGYTAAITVTPNVTWEGIANTKTITVDVTHGTQLFQLINHRTNYAP
jgi:prepilin-type N-terminal cleavage/methylation domain-containing protein